MKLPSSFSTISTPVLIISAAICGLCSSTQAQTGTIAGSVRQVSPYVGGSARAYSLELGDSYSTLIAQNGKFQLSLPAGSYAVVSSMVSKRKVTQQIDVVRVAGRKKTSIKARVFTRVAVAPGIRVSIGNLQAQTLDGKPVKAFNGKPIVWDDLLINDILNNDNPCKIRVMEDRKYGRYNDILNEVKLQASRYAAKRINYKKALSVLSANAPQYRVTGSFQVTPDMELLGNASLRIVDLRNGQTVWSGEFTGLTDMDKFSTTLAQSAAAALCIPRRVTGTFDGVQHVIGSGISVDYNWTGSATFKLSGLIASNPNKPTNQDVALYLLETSNIDSYSTSGSVGGCSVSANAGSTAPQAPSTAAMMVWLNPDSQLGYRYVIAIELMHLDAVIETHHCPDGTSSTSEPVTGELQVSDSEASYPYTQDPYNYQGTFTINSTTMNWAFTAGL